MQERLTERLRYFWDQGLGGADLVWAAVGPALESYSRHPEVRRVDGSPYPVAQFLREVRRLVTDFALGNILHGTSTETVDERTRYYLMHRYGFGLGPAPAGECILLSQAYGIDLAELRGPRGLLTTAARPRPSDTADEEAEDEGADAALSDDEGSEAEASVRGSGSELRLLTFSERTRPDLGEPQSGMPTPYIDALHLLMRHWAEGRPADARAYLDRTALTENESFWAVAQSVLEMADAKSRERSVLEALVAWGRPRTADAADGQPAAVQARIDTAKIGEGR